MNTTAASTVSLSTVAGRVEIRVNDAVLATTKDGGNLIQRVDRILKQHKVYRESGYTLADGSLAATAYDLRCI